MRTVSSYVKRAPAACWRAFTDASVLAAWVPGLRRARVIATRTDGLAAEIQFEFSTSLTYSLIYSYDPDRYEIRWEPRAGKRDAVRGYVRFEAFDHGTRIEYGLEHGDGRSTAERSIGAPEALVAAFVRWMEETR